MSVISDSFASMWAFARQLAMLTIWLALPVVFVAPVGLSAQASLHGSRVSGFLTRQVAFEGREHHFVVFVPQNTEPRLPLVVCLHGSDLAGAGGLLPLSRGLGVSIMRSSATWPFVTLFPQLLPGLESWQSVDLATSRIVDLVAEEMWTGTGVPLVGTGWGVGAEGVLRLAAKNPERFVGVVIVDAPLGALKDYAQRATLPTMVVETVRDDQRALDTVWASHDMATRRVNTVVLRLRGEDVAEVYQEEAVRMWMKWVGRMPVLASALVDPSRIQKLQISLTKVEFSDAWPVNRVTVVEFGCDDGEWYWRVTDGRGERAGKLRALVAIEIAGMLGRDLHRAGILDVGELAMPRPAEGIAVQDMRMEMKISIASADGVWSATRELPFGSQADPALSGVLRGLNGCQDNMLRYIRQ